MSNIFRRGITTIDGCETMDNILEHILINLEPIYGDDKYNVFNFAGNDFEISKELRIIKKFIINKCKMNYENVKEDLIEECRKRIDRKGGFKMKIQQNTGKTDFDWDEKTRCAHIMGIVQYDDSVRKFKTDFDIRNKFGVTDECYGSTIDLFGFNIEKKRVEELMRTVQENKDEELYKPLVMCLEIATGDDLNEENQYRRQIDYFVLTNEEKSAGYVVERKLYNYEKIQILDLINYKNLIVFIYMYFTIIYPQSGFDKLTELGKLLNTLKKKLNRFIEHKSPKRFNDVHTAYIEVDDFKQDIKIPGFFLLHNFVHDEGGLIQILTDGNKTNQLKIQVDTYIHDIGDILVSKNVRKKLNKENWIKQLQKQFPYYPTVSFRWNIVDFLWERANQMIEEFSNDSPTQGAEIVHNSYMLKSNNEVGMGEIEEEKSGENN